MNNSEIKELALSCGFKLKEQPNGEQDLNPYVYDFARAVAQHGKPKRSHRKYISDLLKDAAECRPIKTPGYLVTVYSNDSCADNPRLRWNYFNGVENANFEMAIPDTREELNKALNHGKGCMKSASNLALNPDLINGDK